MMQFLNSIITIAGASVVIFITEWRLGLVIVGVGILSFYMQHRFTKPLAQVGTAQLAANADSLKAATNIFSGAVTIRAYNMQDRAYLAFDKENMRLKKLDYRRGMIRLGQRLFGTVEGWLTLTVTFGLGGWLVARGEMPFNLLASVYIMASSLTAAIGDLGNNYANLQPPIAGAKRVFAVLDRNDAGISKTPTYPIAVNPSTHSIAAGSPTRPMTASPPANNALSVRNLTFQYRDAAAPALHNISLEIQENEMVVFIGESGSGKSTLLKILAGLYHRDDLDITIGGQPFAATPLEKWRHNFAYVDQNSKLFDMTIRENIALGSIAQNPTPDEEAVHIAAKAAAVHDFILSLPEGYDTKCGEGGEALSGGQKQRIAIARALMKKTPNSGGVLVFDEATAALDAETEARIMETIQTLRGQYTILMATHNPGGVTGVHRVVRLDDGRVCC
jgi:ABC-type multidrug transport system fused ATPase/permease subunit